MRARFRPFRKGECGAGAQLRQENFQIDQTAQPRSKLMFEEGSNEAELEKMTDTQIDQLYKLTRQFKTSSRRGELWLRLAEAYVDKSKLIDYKIQTEHDRRRRVLFAEGKGFWRPPPKLDLRPAPSSTTRKPSNSTNGFSAIFRKIRKPIRLFTLSATTFSSSAREGEGRRNAIMSAS